MSTKLGIVVLEKGSVARLWKDHFRTYSDYGDMIFTILDSRVDGRSGSLYAGDQKPCLTIVECAVDMVCS